MGEREREREREIRKEESWRRNHVEGFLGGIWEAFGKHTHLGSIHFRLPPRSKRCWWNPHEGIDETLSCGSHRVEILVPVVPVYWKTTPVRMNWASSNELGKLCLLGLIERERERERERQKERERDRDTDT